MPTIFMRMRRTGVFRNLLAGFSLLLAGCLQLLAGSLVARLEPESIAAGDTATLQLIFKDCGRVAAPQLPPIPGCALQYAGAADQFVVGSEGTFRAVIHSYTIQPSTSGVVEIPGYTIEIDGQKLTSQPLKLTVGKGFDQSEVGFLKVVLPKTTAYLGETFPAEVRFYFKTTPAELQSVPTLKLDGFIINRQGERQNGNERIGNELYSVVSWRMALTAVKTGDLSAGPAELETIYNFQSRGRRRGPFDDPFFERMFGGGERRKLTFTSETNVLHVIAPPMEGRPAGFNGAVGRFNIELTATPSQVNVGDPVTVRGKISGRGAFDSLKLPDFPTGNGFQVYAGTNSFEPADDLGLTGTKSFEQVLVPERGDLKSIQWPPFSFWDPETRRYETLKPNPLPLQVHGTAVAQAAPAGQIPAGGAAQAVPAVQSTEFRPPTLKEGTRQIIRAPHVTQPWFLGLLLLPGVAWAVLAGVIRWNSRPRDTARLARETRTAEADREYQSVIQSARNGDSAAFFRSLNHWLQLRLALVVDGSAGTFTSEVVDSRLRRLGLPDATAEQLHRLFLALDQARYSVDASAARIESLQADAEAVEAVLKTWRPSR